MATARPSPPPARRPRCAETYTRPSRVRACNAAPDLPPHHSPARVQYPRQASALSHQSYHAGLTTTPHPYLPPHDLAITPAALVPRRAAAAKPHSVSSAAPAPGHRRAAPIVRHTPWLGRSFVRTAARRDLAYAEWARSRNSTADSVEGSANGLCGLAARTGSLKHGFKRTG